MSRLAQNWAEKSFNLPRPIVNLEKDFSNGYLLIKMLQERNVLHEDEVADVVDGDTPTVVMKNMHVLARGLKSLQLHLTKQQTADIISEQPGGAADLIMSLKRKFEGVSTSPKWRNDSYKNATRSLKPKTFKRTIEKAQDWTEEEAFFVSTLAGKKNANFRDVDAFAQQEHYFEFDTRQEKLYKERLAQQQKRHKEAVVERRQRILENLDHRIDQHEQTLQAGTRNWKANQTTKRDRQIRDLQFELCLEAKATQRRIMENTLNRTDQETGIEQFENNLKRNGIGGEEGEGDGVLLPSTEDSNLFMQRVEASVAETWPTDGEVGDFMQTLEKRTRELRLARAEKARRKRRMQVEQNAALNEMGVSTTGSINEDTLEGTMTENDRKLKADHKQQEYERLTVQAAADSKAIADRGEDQVRIFAERVRMMSYESNSSAETVAAVLEAQRKRREEKSKRNYETCRSLVLELVADSLTGVGAHVSSGASQAASLPQSRSQHMSHSQSITKGSSGREDDAYFSQLAADVIEIQKQERERNEERIPGCDFISRSPAVDLLPSAVILANNTAKWRNSCELDEQAGVSRIRTLSFREKAIAVFGQVTEYDSCTELCPFRIDASGNVENLEKRILDHLSHVKESAREETDHTATPAGCVTSPYQTVVLLLGGQHDLSPSILEEAGQWLGGEHRFSLWDVPRAAEVALSLCNSATGGTEGGAVDCTLITGATLCSSFGIDPQSFPDDHTLSVQATRTVSEVVDVVTRITTCVGIVGDDGTVSAAELDQASFKFNDTTLVILLGQILWLREYICSVCYNHKGVHFMPTRVLVGTIVGYADKGCTAKILDWFIRGGNRMNIPEGDEQLRTIIAEEIASLPPEKGKKGKPAPKGKKDKNKDATEVISDKSSIATVIWIRSGCVSPIDDETDMNIRPIRPTERDDVKVILAYKQMQRRQWSTELKELSKSFEREVQVFSVANKCRFHIYQPGHTKTSQLEPEMLPATDINCDFNAVEYIVAAVLDGMTLESTAATDDPTMDADQIDATEPEYDVSAIEESQARVHKLVMERRELLDPAQMIWLNHVTKLHTIDFSLAPSLLCTLRTSGMKELDILASLIFVSVLQLRKAQADMRYKHTIQVNAMKIADNQWQKLCMQFRDEFVRKGKELTSVPMEKVKAEFRTLSRVLECELGDVIDIRHKNWIHQAADLNVILTRIIGKVCAVSTDIVSVINSSLVTIVKTNATAAYRIADTFSSCGYERFPWPLKTDLSKGGTSRVEYQRLRDEVRHRITLLKTALCLYNDDEVELGISSQQELDCSEMLANIDKLSDELEIPDTPEVFSLRASVLHEIRNECLSLAVSVLKALHDSILKLDDVKQTFMQQIDGYILKRNSYEHDILQKWMGELREKFNGSTEGIGFIAAAEFMSGYYFGVSDDPDQDGIPKSSLANRGLVNVGEMSVNTRKLRYLSLELLASRVEEESSSNTFSPREFLTATVKNIFDHGENMPSVWRQINKLHSLADTVCSSSTFPTDDSERFSRALVMRLALARLPMAPPSVYVVKLCSKLLGQHGEVSQARYLSPDSPTVVPLSQILSTISQDKNLCMGWWPYKGRTDIDYDNHLTAVLYIIEAIALTCAVTNTAVFNKDHSLKSVDICIDKFLHILSHSPSLKTDVMQTFQNSLCAVFDPMESAVEPANDMNCVGNEASPDFIYEGFTKLAHMISKLVLPISDSARESLLSGEEAEAAFYESSLLGPPLTSTTLVWMADILGVSIEEFVKGCKTNANGDVLLGHIIELMRAEYAKLCV